MKYIIETLEREDGSAKREEKATIVGNLEGGDPKKEVAKHYKKINISEMKIMRR